MNSATSSPPLVPPSSSDDPPPSYESILAAPPARAPPRPLSQIETLKTGIRIYEATKPIQGAYIVIPPLASEQEELETEGARTSKVSLEAMSGDVDVDVFIQEGEGEETIEKGVIQATLESSGEGGKRTASLSVQSQLGAVTLRLHDRPPTTSYDVTTRSRLTTLLSLPHDFTGALSVTARSGRIVLSPALKPRSIVVWKNAVQGVELPQMNWFIRTEGDDTDAAGLGMLEGGFGSKDTLESMRGSEFARDKVDVVSLEGDVYIELEEERVKRERELRTKSEGWAATAWNVVTGAAEIIGVTVGIGATVLTQIFAWGP